jgi:transposase-like protein
MALLRWSIGSGIETDRMRISSPDSSAPAGYRFPREVIPVAVRWYLRKGCRIATWRNCWLSAASRSIT